jgi:hypothetical protein
MLSLARLGLGSLGSIALHTSCRKVGVVVATPMLDWDDVIYFGRVLATIAAHPPIPVEYG